MSNRDSLDRSSVEVVGATTANGPLLNVGSELQATDEAFKYQSPVSSNDLSTAVDRVLKSDVCSKSVFSPKNVFLKLT